MIDPDRAAFVSQQYRYTTVTDNGIRASNTGAQEVVIETQLSEAAASALAYVIFDNTSTLAQVYQIEIEEVLNFDDFANGVPHFRVNSGLYGTDDRIFKVISAEIDHMAGVTTVTVRG